MLFIPHGWIHGATLRRVGVGRLYALAVLNIAEPHETSYFQKKISRSWLYTKRMLRALLTTTDRYGRQKSVAVSIENLQGLAATPRVVGIRVGCAYSLKAGWRSLSYGDRRISSKASPSRYSHHWLFGLGAPLKYPTS
jgi:hypothetical protein